MGQAKQKNKQGKKPTTKKSKVFDSETLGLWLIGLACVILLIASVVQYFMPKEDTISLDDLMDYENVSVDEDGNPIFDLPMDEDGNIIVDGDLTEGLEGEEGLDATEEGLEGEEVPVVEENTELSALDGLANDIQNSVEFAMTMSIPKDDESSLDYLKDSCGFDTSLMKDFTVRNNMMTNSDLLFIVEANSSEDVPTIKAMLETHKANVMQSFENYLPEQYDLAEQGQVVENGNYVMLVISQDNDTAIDLFTNGL
jgi:hypothetical protein